jgi:hypothetical protein
MVIGLGEVASLLEWTPITLFCISAHPYQTLYAAMGCAQLGPRVKLPTGCSDNRLTHKQC